MVEFLGGSGADGFVEESSRVKVPDEASEAHASFVRMFLSLQRWGKATIDTFSAGDAAGEEQFARLASSREDSQRAIEQHRDDVSKMLKDHKLPVSESDWLMRGALKR